MNMCFLSTSSSSSFILYSLIILLTSMIEETYSFPSRVGQLFDSHPNERKISKLTATSVESDESWLIQSTLSPLIENISNLSQTNIIPTTKKARPIVRGLDDFRVQSKGRLRLRCKVAGVAGNPFPRIQWFRNGRKLRNSRRISIINKRKSSLLEIRKVRASLDTGYYECRASNALVKEPAVARVRVIVTRPVQSTTPKSHTQKIPKWSSPSPRLSHNKTDSNPTTTLKTVTSTMREPPTPTNEYQTRSCPIPNFCLNGGQCTFYESVGEYVCKCAEGFRGVRCEMKLILVDLYSVYSS